jgi:hypothetical protein
MNSSARRRSKEEKVEGLPKLRGHNRMPNDS